MRRIAILAASKRELRPARAAVGMVDRRRLGSFGYEVGCVGGVEVHLVNTGVGAVAARSAAQAIVSEVALDAMVSTGYAGALGPAGIGELIVGTEVLAWLEEKPRMRFSADPALLAVARLALETSRLQWTQGIMVTVGNVMWRASDKRALGKASGAVAVDMESAAIAQVAGDRGVPFLSVRAVSDRVDEDLPMDFNLWLMPWGCVRGTMQILLHPSILRSLLRTKRHVEGGSEHLAGFFKAFFAVLDEGRLHAEAFVLASAGER